MQVEVNGLREQVREALEPLRGRDGVLIPALQAVQEKLGYVPELAMEEIGEVAGMSANTVYGVASFYAQFRFIKPGEHMVKVCLGTACHVCGAMGILDSLQRELKVEPGGTTEDDKFSLETVRCVGSCALAPVMVVDEEAYGNLTPTKAAEILAKF